MTEPGRYDAAPALVAAFALAGLSQTWRLAPHGVVSSLVADAALLLTAAVALAAVVRWAASDLDLTSRAADLSDPRWSLAPLVALIATQRLADLSPAAGRPLLAATATFAAVVSATSAARLLRSRCAPNTCSRPRPRVSP